MADESLPWEAAFVENVTRARKRHGLSQTELAKRLAARGLSFHQPTVQRMEAGTRPVRLNEAVVIAEALNMSLEEAIAPLGKERSVALVEDALTLLMHGMDEYSIMATDLANRIDHDVTSLEDELARHRSVLDGPDDEIARMAALILDVMVSIREVAWNLPSAISKVFSLLRHPSRSQVLRDFLGKEADGVDSETS